MSQLSLKRRFAGRALLGLGVLALPLTASISYAASETAQEVPEPPAPPAPPAPPEAPEPPMPPEAPMEVVIIKMDPDAPDAPDAPPAPDAPGGKDDRVIEQVFKDEDGKERRVRMVLRGGTGSGGAEPRIIMRRIGPDGAGMAKGDHDAMMIELREGLAEADRELADLPRMIREAEVEARAARGEAGRARAEARTRVMMSRDCKPGGSEPTETTTGKDGTTRVIVCERRVFRSAASGLQEARDEIAANKDIPEDTRKEVLRTLDAQIARWKDKEG